MTRAYYNPNLSLPIDERVKALFNEIIADPNYNGFDVAALKHCTFISASAEKQSTSWELNVTPDLCNKSGNLHGGAAATILDSLTSTALLTIAKPGFLDAGHVSRTLSTTYTRPVPAGTKCRVECEVVAAGKNTAMVRGIIMTMDGKACVHCAHDKAVFKKANL